MSGRLSVYIMVPVIALLVVAGCREHLEGSPCSFYVDYDLDPYPPVEDLAWSSGQIVVGTVSEDLGPDWAEPDNVSSSRDTRGCLEIMNDYEIEVERQFFGESAETLRIRAPGGELDGYEQLHGIAPDLEPGERYLFFLFKAPESEMLPDAWAFDLQRARRVLADERITTGHDSSMTLGEIEQLVEETLDGEPPAMEDRLRSLWGSEGSEQFDDEWGMPDDN